MWRHSDEEARMAEQARLKTGALGAAGITFLVVAAAAPLTVMTGVAPLAVSIGGIGAPVGYLLAGVVLTIFAVGFTAMTRHTRGAGAFYSYITLGLGRPLGAAAGLLAVLSYNALQIGVYGLLGVQFAGAWTRFAGREAPWWIFTALGIAGVWALGRRGIDVGARVIGTLLIAETAILALLVAGVLKEGGAGGLTAGTFTPDAVTSPGMLAILGFCFAAFMGFESTALYRGEARRPDRSIPRATSATVLAYFLRRRGVPGARIAIAAGGLALILLAGVLHLLVDNVALLTGAAFGANVFLLVLVPAILSAGVAWALRIKIKSPSAYARIGAEEVRAMNPVPSTPVVEDENHRTEEAHA
jgi:amino acid transporter